MLENQADSPFANLRRITCRMSSHNSSPFSQDGASGKAGAVQLEVYALRWGIEVYFKEAKQHLGFLVEQTRTFTSHTASIHLCAIRYLMLVHAKLSDDGARIGELRADIQDQLNLLSFAGRLWQVFRAIISDTLDELGDTLGCSVETLMKMFDEKVGQFLVQCLQLDASTRLLHKSRHVIVTRTPTFRVANASQNSPCSIRPCHDRRPIASVAYPYQR